MILLCGIPSERPIALVAQALDGLGARYVWFHQRRFDELRISVRLDEARITGMLRINGDALPLESIRAVYARLMDDRALPELRGEPTASPRAQRCRALHAALIQWMETTPARVINRTNAMASNGSKPFQAQLIRAHGFETPETLITNDPELVLEFRRRHEKIIYKSLSGVRSIVKLFTDHDLPRLGAIRWCPTQFQQFIDGTNIRVHVVGEEVFATSATTTAVDYRYAEREGNHTELEPVMLSDELRARCVSLAAALGLEFAGIDLKRTAGGRVYCFEVNPSPGFSYFEASTGQPIAAAVARRLIGRPPPVSGRTPRR